ncbi:MAG: hypothetical protein FJ387_02110 [Verrucomicrobia bacterium]|nr:hypothetical protein [Verrucomicrobiota bacterium]
MRFPYSAGGKPLLPLVLSLGAKELATEALLDRGAEVNVLPWRLGEALGARWDDRKTTLRLAGALAGTPGMPLLLLGRFADVAPVRLAFAWCRTDDVPLILGQTNFFMEFDICFFRSRQEFSVVPKGSAIS